jgi:hypothetical protein
MSTQTYVVKKGDNLWNIATKIYKIKPEDLYKANPQIKNKNLIYPNQKINIPVPPTPKKTTTTKTTPPPTASKPKPLVQLPSVTLLDKPVVAKLGSSPAGTANVKGMFDDVPFSFNPEELIEDKGNEYTYTETSNNYYPIMHYKGGQTPTLQFELYVNDQEEEGACMRLINKLNMHLPQENFKNHKGLPPKPIIFSFGKHYVKRVWLENFKIRRTLFNPELRVKEAFIQVNLIMHTG